MSERRLSKRTFRSMYRVTVEALLHLIPRVRWHMYTDVHMAADGLVCMERRFVIYRLWMGRQYDYTELALGRSYANTGSTEEEPWHAER